MKMFKKLMALTLAVLMLLTSMTFTAVANTVDTNRSTLKLDQMAARWGGPNLLNANGGTYTISSDAYNTGITGSLKRAYLTNVALGGSYTRAAGIYRGEWATNSSAAGWYQVYIDRITHGGSTPAPLCTVNVIHRDGTDVFVIDRNLANGQTGWSNTRHYVGTFYFANSTAHQIRVFQPLSYPDTATTKYREDLGAVICVPVTGADDGTDEKTKENSIYLKPVYTADITEEHEGYTKTGGAKHENYQGNSQLLLDGSKGVSTLKIPYNSQNSDLVEALAFEDNEGAIEFDLAWNYTKAHGVLSATDAAKDENKDYVAPYFSVKYARSDSKSAEIKIYGNHAELIDNGVTTPLLNCDNYLYFYNSSSNISEINTVLNGNVAWKYNVRIQILDVNRNPNGLEATSRKVSKDGANGKTKLLKIFLNGGESSEILMAAAYLPSTSIFYETDTDGVENNYFMFTNSPGSNTTNAEEVIKIKNISVMVPDENIKASNMIDYENKLSLSAEGDKAIYSREGIVPLKVTNRLYQTRWSRTYVGAVASYDSKKNMKIVAPYYLDFETGDRKSVDISIDVENGDTVKFFKWNDFNSMTPYAEQYKEITVE